MRRREERQPKQPPPQTSLQDDSDPSDSEHRGKGSSPSSLGSSVLGGKGKKKSNGDPKAHAVAPETLTDMTTTQQAEDVPSSSETQRFLDPSDEEPAVVVTAQVGTITKKGNQKRV